MNTLHIRLTSIQAPTHDPMMVQLAEYLNNFFESEYAKEKLAKYNSITEIIFEFPLCQRRSFSENATDDENVSLVSNTTATPPEKHHHHEEQEQKNDTPQYNNNKNNRPKKSSCCQIDIAGSIGSEQKFCTCGSKLLSWMERAKLLDDGDFIQCGWLCGLPLILAIDGYTNGIYSAQKYFPNKVSSSSNPEIVLKQIQQDSSSSSDDESSKQLTVGCHSNNTKNSSSSSSKNFKMPYTSETPFAPDQASLQKLHKKWQTLAAPRMNAPRYDKVPFPCYFSDVIVRKDDERYSDFDSLFSNSATTRWGFNEPHSQSGFNVTRNFLWERRRKILSQLEHEEPQSSSSVFSFFQVQQIGSHQESIQSVIENKIDAAAIDSTVLETEVERNPNLLKDKIRIIHPLGPSPSPPFVVNRVALEKLILKNNNKNPEEVSKLADTIQSLIREALTIRKTHQDDGDDDHHFHHIQKLIQERDEILKTFGVLSFDVMNNEDYDRVRTMLKHSLDFPSW